MGDWVIFHFKFFNIKNCAILKAKSMLFLICYIFMFLLHLRSFHVLSFVFIILTDDDYRYT